MKTAVETVFIGKDRQYNRRFLRMCGHYLVEPTACTPAAGWEKGQVENQVGLVRERFFTPRLRVTSYDELNAWLLDRCVAYAKAHKHPEHPTTRNNHPAHGTRASGSVSEICRSVRRSDRPRRGERSYGGDGDDHTSGPGRGPSANPMTDVVRSGFNRLICSKRVACATCAASRGAKKAAVWCPFSCQHSAITMLRYATSRR